MYRSTWTPEQMQREFQSLYKSIKGMNMDKDEVQRIKLLIACLSQMGASYKTLQQEIKIEELMELVEQLQENQKERKTHL